MNIAQHLEELTKLQTAIDETLNEPPNSYAYAMVRPKLVKELGQAVEKARKAGITEGDIDELVAVLELTTGRRPINLEFFWDSQRIAKGWREKKKS